MDSSEFVHSLVKVGHSREESTIRRRRDKGNFVKLFDDEINKMSKFLTFKKFGKNQFGPKKWVVYSLFHFLFFFFG